MTRPPIRLLESADLSAAERALLEAGRTVPAVHYDITAGAAKFQASLQGLPPGASPATGTTTALAKTAALTKFAVVLVPTLGAVAAYYAMRAEPRPVEPTRAPTVVEQPIETIPAPVAMPDAEAAPPPAPMRNVAPVVRAAPRVAIKAEPTRSPSRAAPPSSVRNSAHDTAATSTSSATAVAATPSAQAEKAVAPEPTPEPPATPETPEAPTPAATADSINELRGIASARALIDRDPAAALVILQRLSRAHPQGYFVEERAALTVLALAADDKEDDARKHAARFLRAYPTSPFADRVRNAVR